MVKGRRRQRQFRAQARNRARSDCLSAIVASHLRTQAIFWARARDVAPASSKAYVNSDFGERVDERRNPGRPGVRVATGMVGSRA
jgi:hypothetical protein